MASTRKRRRLKGMEVEKVSIVDRAANLREWLLLKRLKGESNMDDEITDVAVEELEIFDPDILKALEPSAAKAVARAVAILNKVKEKLPKGLQSAVSRLEAAAGGKPEKEGYPPPDKVKKSKDADAEDVEDGDVRALLKTVAERQAKIEAHLGIAPEQMVSMRDAEQAAEEIVNERLAAAGA